MIKDKFDLSLKVKRVKISQEKLHDLLIAGIDFELKQMLEEDKKLLKLAKSILSEPNGKIVKVDEFDFELDSNAREISIFKFDFEMSKKKAVEKQVSNTKPKVEKHVKKEPKKEKKTQTKKVVDKK